MIARLLLSTAIFWSVLSCSIVLAQVTTATILGIAKDDTGAVLPGVSITVRHLGTARMRTVLTDDAGRYHAPNLALGNYEVEAELAGFQTAVRSGIKLSLGQEAVVDFIMKVGQISEKVVVTGEAPLVNTTSGALAGLVDDKTMRDLPLNGRDYVQLATLQPGVVATTRVSRSFSSLSGGGTKLTVNGARPEQNTFLLDGTDINDAINKTPGSVAGISMGVETLREFRVLTNNFSAEFGRAGGAVINTVTKSGTNELHGSVFEFLRNSALDARNFFDRESNPPPFKRNQFGFVLGGPVKKDQTFFLGSYEGLRERLAITRKSRVPTVAARQGILPGRTVSVSPVIRPYFDLYPLPTPGGINFGDGIAEFIFAKTEPTDEDFFVVKVDHQFSSHDSFFVRYTFDDSSHTFSATFPQFAREDIARRQVVTIEEQKVLSSALLNIFRFGFNRAVTGTVNLITELDPNLSFIPGSPVGHINVGGLTATGNHFIADLLRIWNSFEWSDGLSYTRGAHLLKFGGEAKRIQTNGLQGFSRNGNFTFPTLERFLLNQATNLDVILPGSIVERGYRQNLFGFYIQDDFSFGARLNLNLGLRYEFITVPTEVNGRVANLRNVFEPRLSELYPINPNADMAVGDPYFENPSLKNFAPRFGFAWDPTGSGKTSVRGGFGIFHDQFLPKFFLVAAYTTPPFLKRLNIPNPQFPRGWLNADVTQLLRNLEVEPINFRFSTPYLMQYNLTLQREIMPNLVLTLAYAGSHGVHLTRNQNVNIALFDLLPDGRKFFPANSPRPNQNFQSLDLKVFDSNSSFNSVQLGLQKRLSRGLQFQFSYTFSSMIDEAAGQNGGSSGGTTVSMDPFDHKRDRSKSAFNVPNNLVFSYIYDLPFGSKRRFGSNLDGMIGNLIEGWQIGGIVSFADGPQVPVKMVARFNPSRSLNVTIPDQTADRPDLAPGANSNPVRSNFDPNTGYLDSSAFVLQTPGFYGNLGRNTVRAPGIANVDFSLFKSASVTETVNVQFRAEFFNIFNRANFEAPDVGIFRDSSGIPAATFGRISSTTTTARQIQFALKLTF